jgi:hypothetical protein
MSPARARHLFVAGLLIFLAAKLYLVLLPATALATPRLGDDAMAYLWKGERATLRDADSRPALQDIRNQRFLDDHPSEEVAWLRSDVAHRTLGTLTASYDYLAAGALALAPDLRWAFAFTEVAGVLTMAAGMAWFLFELCGAAVAGLAMMLMAFAVLPGQGIYAFIPGTMSLSCGLLLWAYLWRKGADSSAWVVLVASLPLLGIHPIAKIYVALVPAILWLRLGHLADWRALVLWRVSLACTAALGASLLLPMLLPALQPPPSAIMGQIDLHRGIDYNLSAVLPLLADPMLRKNLLWAFLLAGGLVLAPRASFPQPLALMFAGTVTLLAVSFVYFQPLNAGQLFIRLWVLFVLLGAAAGASFVVHLLSRDRLRRRLALTVTMGGMLVSAILWVMDYVPHTMNWRDEVLEEMPIRTRLAAFPADTTLLYADTYIALQAALLLDGYRLGALAYPMLAGTPSLARLVSDRKPAAIVTPGFTSLNSLATQHAKNFVHRRQGLYMPAVDQFAVSRGAGLPLDGLRVLMENSDPVATLTWQPVDAAGHILGPTHDTLLPTGMAWIPLPVPANAATVRVSLPNVRAWVLGLSPGTPTAHVLWPWKANWSLSYRFREEENAKTVRVEFTPRSLLEQVQAEALVPYVDAADPVLADDGGLVFLRTTAPTDKLTP